MTREEAIKVLKKYKRYAESILTNEVLDSIAFDMAIEALSSDTVSRETYHNLVIASNDIDRALREYQDKEENGELVSVVRCEDCRHRNTWDNPRLDPQYYRCGKGVKFRDYGYVREDDYCPLGERREP